MTTIKMEIAAMEQEWDVIVAGGGPAGAIAAAAAARDGAKTLLLERTGCLGGMGTTGLVGCWCPFTDGEKIIYKGLAERVFHTTRRGLPLIGKDEIHGHLPFDPEQLKRIYEDIVLEFGADILFHSVVAGAEVRDGRIAAIVVANKSGLRALTAKVYIDCTGDADLAAFAGAACDCGDAATGATMPGSLCFNLSNVDDYSYQYLVRGTWGGNPDSPIWKIMASDRYPEINSMHLCSNLIGPSSVNFNAGHLYFNPLEPAEISRAMIDGRRKAAVLTRALRECSPEAFGAGHLVATADVPGVRESRRIRGLYTLTLEDYLERRDFADGICRNSYFLDIHQDQSRQAQCRTYDGFQAYLKESRDFNAKTRYRKGESHAIPYRSLVPEGLTNLLVAGRSISCDRHVLSSIRVMPVCMAMGEAAGTAAALALEQSCPDVTAVDTVRLRERLTANGALV